MVYIGWKVRETVDTQPFILIYIVIIQIEAQLRHIWNVLVRYHPSKYTQKVKTSQQNNKPPRLTMTTIYKKYYHQSLSFLIYFTSVIWLNSLAVSTMASSTSDMLMIRHGRSRVRHSTEKNHIRWGLKAFDNLTLVDYDYDNANTTTNEIPYEMTAIFVGGGNQSLLETTNVFGSSDANDINTMRSSSSSGGGTLSTSVPSSSNRPSFVSWTSAPATASSTPRKKLGKKQIMENIRKDVDAGVEYLRTHAHLQSPTMSMPELRTVVMYHRSKTVNGEKNRGTIWDETLEREQMQGDDGGAVPTPLPTNSHEYRLATVSKHIESNDKHNSNGSSLKPSQTSRKKLAIDKRNGSAPTTATPPQNEQKFGKGLNPGDSDRKISRNAGLDGVAGRQRYGVKPDELSIDDNHANDTHGDGDLPFSPSGLYSSVEASDDGEIGDEQSNGSDLNDERGDTAAGQHQMEYIDLDDLDEISRDNRMKMKKGSDVLTRFLEIVESQHLLGANCTAGTALNLGEGVVDQYAQERFQTTVEVAVNRANMLTR